MQIINLENIASQRFNTVLNSQRLEIEINYIADGCGNAQNGWYINATLITATETEIVSLGSKINADVQLFQGVSTTFNGGIFAISITSPKQDLIDANPWGITHLLIYLTNEEIEFYKNNPFELEEINI